MDKIASYLQYYYREQQKMENDKLSDLFKIQMDLQIKLGNNKKVIWNQEYINNMSLALIDEILEALRETPWKPWKKQQSLNKERYKEEIIDAWNFLINLSLAAGMTSNEIYERFIDKNKINHKRKETGY